MIPLLLSVRMSPATPVFEQRFAPRNSVDTAEAYREFRGRDATIDAPMLDRGSIKNH